ncbi:MULTISPECIES: hypothetical protein [unclassified Sinorhizobium]|uniref:hypothetical protein n=1 Tax=unclassified Sinorhizobium TaxID=2613772 RepID=UPI003523C8E6
MSIRHLAVLLMTSLLPAVLAGCDVLGFHSWQWHQKLTIVVETPEGERAGSAVSLVEVSLSPRWWGVGDFAGSGTSSLSGEAVVLDVEHDKYLFALLKGYSHETATKTFFKPTNGPRSRQQSIAAYDTLEKLRETRELPSSLFPIFVTFTNVSDPASARQVDPSNLEATFGPGYGLKSVTISITDEPVTRGMVEKVLGHSFFKTWATKFKAALRDAGPFGDRPFAFQLQRNDFLTGE